MNRLLTAAVGVPATILVILYAPDFLFALIVAVAATRCLWEFMDLGKSRLGVRPAEWVLLVGALVTLSFTAGVHAALLAMALAVLVTITAIAFATDFSMSFQKGAFSIMGIVYCAFLPGFLLLLRREQVLVLLGILWIGDAAAYYGGRRFGKHPLAPALSPKKTVEGAFAGLIGSIIAGVALGVWVARESSGVLLVASIASACAGQVGDLVESALKRTAGVKDSAALLPGHGGLLDRLDGLLFAAPVYYWFFMR
jgi:phosphatidate cytidylyltransferase